MQEKNVVLGLQKVPLDMWFITKSRKSSPRTGKKEMLEKGAEKEIQVVRSI